MELIYYFLIFLVINLGLLYWFQVKVLNAPVKASHPAKNGFSGDNSQPRDCQSSDFVNNKCRLAGLKGPVTGFHQAFSPSVNRELGWRNFFIRKYGGLGTSTNPDNGIMGSLTQNFLDNLSSTDNVYAQTNY